MTPTFVDLFSGAGGLSLGLVKAGWRPLVAIDNWPDAVKTFRANHPTSDSRCMAIQDVDPARLLDQIGEMPDWIVGGPPCQGFSTVGKRERLDPRNQLVWEFLDIVDKIRPPNVLIENVLGLRDMRFVDEICRALASIGYVTSPFVLRAADYGVPQLRRRVFFVADAEGRMATAPPVSHDRTQWVSVWDAIGDLPPLGPGESSEKYTVEPRTAFQRLAREGSTALQGHKASRHPARLVKAISFIPDGGSRRHIPRDLQPRSGFHNSYSRLHSQSPAVAVTQNMGKPSATRCIHPFQDRGLTAREGARLQGFPDRYHFSGGVSSQRLQIANAVPPILAAALGRHLSDQRQFVCAATGDLSLFAAQEYLYEEVG